MTDEQLLRYARHVMLDEIGIAGQQHLMAGHAVIVGAGGLGSPAALYLASAGVGRLTVIDDDTVALSNLQRQIAHSQSRIGQPKVESIKASVAALNPDVQVHALVRRADAALLDQLLPQASVVLDCSDNFATRHMVNAACVRHRIPLVSGAAVGWDAQLSVYDARKAGAPCYACVFPAEAAHEDVACATMGVFAPLVGIVGSMQAAEALKLLVMEVAARPGADAGDGTALHGGLQTSNVLQPITGRLLMLDARRMQWDGVALVRRPQCSVCGDGSVAPGGGAARLP